MIYYLKTSRREKTCSTGNECMSVLEIQNRKNMNTIERFGERAALLFPIVLFFKPDQIESPSTG